MSNFIGNLSVFDYKYQEWQIFYGKLLNFIKLNSIKTENCSAVLLTHLSDDSYRLARNLVHPKNLETVSWLELVEVLNGHFQPKRSTFADRAKFYDAIRLEGESVEEWAVRLRGLAVYCEFGSELDTLLRDRFILGLRAGPERDRLFEQDSKTLSLSKAIEIAQQAACARAARAYVGGGEQFVKKELEVPVYRVGDGRRAPGASAQSPESAFGGPRCTVCGMKNHAAEKCRFKGYKCAICGEKGHLKKVCSVKNGGKVSLNNLDANGSNEHECTECNLYNLRYVNYDPIKVSIFIDNKPYSMEIDCGAGRSVISEQFYLNNFKHYKLIKSDMIFCLYTKHKIIPLGCFSCEIVYNNLRRSITFYVIKEGGPPLLGRDFMSVFDMNLVCMSYNNKLIDNTECGDTEVLQILEEFPDIWRDELGCFNKFKVELHLKENSVPKFFKPRQIPFALKDKVEAELDRLVKVGILVPVQFSDYATPIVPVLKENGKLKIAGDFSCTLNKVLKIDKYPLPHIEEVFAKIGGGEHYSKLDLSNAYNQLCLSEASQELTTINTPKGLFKYTRLVYGLANAPGIFQRAIETLVAGIEGISCWYDDICLTAPNRTLHLARLRELLGRLQDAGLRLQKDKCTFFQESVTYLGFKIDKSGLRTCPSKVDAVMKAPVPTNVLELKRFLGVVNYYRNFIPSASSLLHPLHELLKEDAVWRWEDRHQRAFTAVRSELASDRVLSHFDPTARLVLTVDAGPAGLGAVLAHLYSNGKEKPIAFGSRSLTPCEKNYSQIQKEATAIVFGVKRFHQYLYGCQEPFILRTDHRPLLSIFGKKDGVSVTAALRLQRYAVMLSAYNYVVQYISNKNNLIADYFSRAPIPIDMNDSSSKQCSELPISFLFMNATKEPVSFTQIQHATSNDQVLKTVINYMKSGWPRKINCKFILPYFMCKTDLEIIKGCVFRGHRLVIPTVYREQMLEELHSAHFGIVKTKSTARSRMWWPGIDGDIERRVGSCSVCAQLRSAPPRAPPSPWPRPPAPWHRIHIDYMSIGQTVYLIVIDAFSKWLECIYMNCGTSTGALISKLKCIFSVFGIPNEIVSDNDVKICSNEFKIFCKNNGINYLNSPIYHPSSNGQAENSVKTCKKMIKCIISENNLSTKVIEEKLLSFLFEYRNTIHCTTGESPAKLMFGRNLRSRLDTILPYKSNLTEIKQRKQLQNSRQFKINEIVMARWFYGRKAKWEIGKITDITGERLFTIYFEKFNCNSIRHLDQIRKYTSTDKATNVSNDDSSSGTMDSELYNPYHVLSPSQQSPMTPPPPAPANMPDDHTDTATVSHRVSSADSLQTPVPTVTPPVLSPAETGNARVPSMVDEREGDGDEWEEAVDIEQEQCAESERPTAVTEYNDAPNRPEHGRSLGRPLRLRSKVDYKKYL